MHLPLFRTLATGLAILLSNSVAAQQWTLTSSVQQAISTSPELQKSVAEIHARQADVRLSGMWPDPEILFRVDNKLGQDDGRGGYDLSDVIISQDIPLSRIKYQKSVAQASLTAARFSREYKLLVVQNRISKVFHQLQFASAKYALAEKRFQLAEILSSPKQTKNNGVVVRYLTPLEKMRLSIIGEEAHQAASYAEGKYNEALNEFAKLLNIEPDMATTVSELRPIDTIPAVDDLLALQETHAQLSSQQQQVQAANHGIDVARSTQTQDPTVSLSRSQESFPGGRGDVYGIMFNVQIPIHKRKSTAVSKASYQASQQRIELQRLRRELQINLKRSVTHLNHVADQAEDYARKVLQPAKKMLDLTQRGFSSGELNMLSLVDANNTYFDARARYLELLYQARVELADVNLFAGQLITHVDAQKISLNNLQGQ